MRGPTTENAGFDAFLDALADGEGYALVCSAGHGSLPPRRVCPHCGASDLEERPLPDAGTVVSATVVRVAAPQFADDAPYVSALASFGPARLTGVLRGVEVPDADGVADYVERDVTAGVEETATNGERLVTFRPVASE